MFTFSKPQRKRSLAKVNTFSILEYTKSQQIGSNRGSSIVLEPSVVSFKKDCEKHYITGKPKNLFTL